MHGKMEDPWSQICIPQHEAKIGFNDNHHEFEDNFSPSLRDTLPDSDEYLAALERKLEKLKNNTDLLRQLEEKREASMQQLLSGEIEYNDEYLELDIPVYHSELITRIQPEQALTVGEVVELIKHDHLDTTDNENLDTTNQ